MLLDFQDNLYLGLVHIYIIDKVFNTNKTVHLKGLSFK